MYSQKSFEDQKAEAEKEGKTFSEDDFKEQEGKMKRRLFGNIEFVGELFCMQIIRWKTLEEIFQTLLEKTLFNDDSVEAALKFMEKTAISIENKFKTDGQTENKKK